MRRCYSLFVVLTVSSLLTILVTIQEVQLNKYSHEEVRILNIPISPSQIKSVDSIRMPSVSGKCCTILLCSHQITRDGMNLYC